MIYFKYWSMLSQVCKFVAFELEHYSCIGLCYADPPGCGCGFMSVERMRLFLNLDSVSLPIILSPSQRQQISPEMRFTCDGNITKWIIGADYDEDVNFYPELQIWRNAGDETYRKINGTFIELQTSLSSRIYEYEDFSPIPVKSGDILGIFLPFFTSSRLRLTSELADSPAQYYLLTDVSVSSSPYDEIDLEQGSVMTGAYHPLVSVEFGESLASLHTQKSFCYFSLVKAPASSVKVYIMCGMCCVNHDNYDRSYKTHIT